MGLSNFPSPLSEGVLPMLVMNTVMSVALVKSKLVSVLQVVAAAADQDSEEDCGGDGSSRERRVSIMRYGSLCRNRCECSVSTPKKCGGGSAAEGGGGNGAPPPAAAECCVCLSGFQAEEEVSELSCRHFFHKGCLDKWFDNQHTTCPLCRSNE